MCRVPRPSRDAYYHWLPRRQEQGAAGLLDASSRPHHSPHRLDPFDEAAIVALRRATGRGADVIGAWLGLPPSTVHRALRRQGLVGGRREREPVVRYEHEQPGDLVHLDTRKLGRIVGGPGHRAHGDRRTRRRGVGWELLHVAIDDATRLVYAEILPDERAATTVAFTHRALSWFADQGIGVRRIPTDDGSPYVSRRFGRTMRRLGIRHQRTRP